MTELSVSLQITLIGMGLVFAALIALWGLMEAVVRLGGADVPEAEEAEESATPVVSINGEESARKRRAALAAVALALHESTQHNVLPLPEIPLVSAWQAVMRTNILHKRGNSR
ncbi:MAG: hypothetical protein OHK0052_17080 [Anaerolineales bacterium]